MRGAEALREMRRSGYAPSLAIIDLDVEKLRMWRDWDRVNPTTAYLSPSQGESPARCDLRCVVGMTVFVQGDAAEDVRAWRDACIAANASRVVAAVTRCVDSRPNYERFEMAELTDTKGILRG